MDNGTADNSSALVIFGVFGLIALIPIVISFRKFFRGASQRGAEIMMFVMLLFFASLTLSLLFSLVVGIAFSMNGPESFLDELVLFVAGVIGLLGVVPMFILTASLDPEVPNHSWFMQPAVMCAWSIFCGIVWGALFYATLTKGS